MRMVYTHPELERYGFGLGCGRPICTAHCKSPIAAHADACMEFSIQIGTTPAISKEAAKHQNVTGLLKLQFVLEN